MRKIKLFIYFGITLISFSGSGQVPELNIHSGHTAWIVHFAISPDEKYLATASYDQTVKLWDFRSGKEVMTLKGHTDYTEQVVFSKDGKYLASGDGRGVIIIWNLSDGSILRKFDDIHWGSISGLAFSNDSRKILSAGEDTLLRVCDIMTGKVIREFFMDGKGMKVDFMPDDNRIVSLDDHGTMILWDVAGDSSINFVRFKQGPITDFALAKNGHYLITSSKTDTNNVRIFDVDTWKIKMRLKGHEVFPSSIVNANDDSSFFTASYIRHSGRPSTFETEIKRWNINHGHCMDSTRKETVLLHGYHLALTPKTNQLISLTSGKTVGIWQTTPLSFSNSIKGGGTLINAIFETGPGKFILFADDGPVKELNLNTGQYQVIGKGFGDRAVRRAYMMQDKKHIMVLGYVDSRIYNLDVETQQMQVVSTDSNDLRSFVMNKGRTHILYYSTPVEKGIFQKRSRLVFKQIGKDSAIASKMLPTYMLVPYNLLQNNITIAYHYLADTISLWHTKSVNAPSYLTSPLFVKSSATGLFPMGDSSLLVTTLNGKLFKWNWYSGKLDTVVVAHPDSWIMNINFSPDGKSFLTSGNDNTVKLWDSKSLTLINTFKGHESWVSFSGYMANGKQIYSTGGDYTLRIWDLQSSKEIASVIMVDTADLVTRLPNQYYTATRHAMRFLSYRIGKELFPFEQFDLRYNRPHEVLKALGNPDSNLINAYSLAYAKRLKRAGFQQSDFNNDIHLPVVTIKGQDNITSLTLNNSLTVSFTAMDEKYLLNSYYVSVNNVPVNGTAGTDLRKLHIKEIEKSIALQLSPGVNKIQISCMNEKGVESLRKVIYITYQPALKKQSQVYFIGIGISKFTDHAMDLRYADKDIRDMASVFRKKYPDCHVDTLLNEAGTKDRILLLKDKLKKTNVDDIVVISISSHGLLDNNLNYYLATTDINFKDPASKGLKYEELEWLLDDIPARKKLLLVDACHSGEIDKDEKPVDEKKNVSDTMNLVEKNFAKGLRPKAIGLQNSFELMKQLFTDVSRGNGSVIISAASGKEFALENATWQNGVFTYCLKKALLEGIADKNGDGISVNELKNYVSENVEILTNGKQRPTTRKENIEFDWRIW